MEICRIVGELELMELQQQTSSMSAATQPSSRPSTSFSIRTVSSPEASINEPQLSARSSAISQEYSRQSTSFSTLPEFSQETPTTTESTSAGNTKIKEDANNAPSNPVIKETPELSESESDDDKQIDDISDSTGTTPPPNENTIKIDTNLAPMDSDLQNISTDPALWPRILGDAERSFLVKQGPPKPLYNYKFPSDDTGRKFSAHYYSRILSNGEQVAQKTWLELIQRLMCFKSIDAAAQRIINSETNHWYEVLLRIVAITKMLGKSCLAFRGTSDKLFEYNNAVTGSKVDNVKWFLDSGVPEHLIGSTVPLISTRKLGEPIKIKVAKSGFFLQASTVGKIKLLSLSLVDEKEIKLTVKDVLSLGHKKWAI
ncbi:hypothetical protein CBL_02943 [Carabus blaptoides fortunei]